MLALSWVAVICKLGVTHCCPFLCPDCVQDLTLPLMQPQRLANQEAEQGPVHDLRTRKGSSASTTPAQHVNTDHKGLHFHLRTWMATH